MWEFSSVTRGFECFAPFSNFHISNRLRINKLCPNKAIILHKVQILKLVNRIQQYENVRVKWASIIISHVRVMAQVWLIPKINWYDRSQFDSRPRQDYETYRLALRPTQSPIQRGPGTIPLGEKRTVRGTDQWPPYSAQFKNDSKLSPHPPPPFPICLHAQA